jgi:uncharacterized protein YabN with tetrapyrrole methylase and pyrophosphatase domain
LSTSPGTTGSDALRAATRKFARRFRYIEDRFAEAGKDIHKATLRQMDRYWEEAKKSSEKHGKRRKGNA